MSARRRRTYRRAMSAARLAGVSDTDIAEVVTALGANPSPDDLRDALAQYEPDLYAPEPRSPFGDGALRRGSSEHAEQAARVDGPAGGGDSATGSCVSPGRIVELSQIPHTGAAALTTVEARGTTGRELRGAVSTYPERESGRALGAQLTEPCQDGLSQGPACEQYPGVAHGDAGSIASLGDHALPPAPRSHNASGGPRGPGSPAACPRTPSDASSPRGASDGPTPSTTVAA